MYISKTRRFAAFLFALLLMVSMLPVNAFAANDCGGSHNWVIDRYDDPTCTEAGVDIYYCRDCGHEEQRAVPALGHAWGAWQVVTQPSCTADGMEQRSCSRCSAIDTRAVPALGHNWVQVITNPGCTTDGVNHTSCSRCSAVSGTTATPALGHDWGAWQVVTQPSCTADGMEQRSCSRCTATETRATPASGHSWGELTVTAEPTCTEPGTGVQYCVHYGCTATNYVEVPPTGHHWVITETESSTNEVTAYELKCSDCFVIKADKNSTESYATITYRLVEGDEYERQYHGDGALPEITKYIESTPSNPDGYQVGEEILFRIDVYNPSEDMVYALSVYDPPISGGAAIATPTLLPGEGASFYVSHVVTEEDMSDPDQLFYSNQAYCSFSGGSSYSNTVKALLCPTDDAAKLPSATLEKSLGNNPEYSFYAVDDTVLFHVVFTNTTGETIYNVNVYDRGELIASAAELAPGGFLEGGIEVPVTEGLAAQGFLQNIAVASYEYENENYAVHSNIVTAYFAPFGIEEDISETIDDGARLPSATLEKSLWDPPEYGFYALDDTILFYVVFTNTTGETIYNVNVYDRGELIASAAELTPGGFLGGGIKVPVTQELAARGSLENIAVASYEYENENYAVHSNIVTAQFAPFGIADEFPEPIDGEKDVTEPIGVEEEFPAPFGIEEEIHASLSVSKSETSSPANGKYYTAGEMISYSVTVTNDGETLLQNIAVMDALASGFSGNIGNSGSLAPGESFTASFTYHVTQTDSDISYVCNTASAAATDSDTGVMVYGMSNAVYSPTSEKFDPDANAPRLAASGEDCCVRTLTVDESGKLGYAIDHCAEHTEMDAEMIELVKDGGSDAWKDAAAIWSNAVYALYDKAIEQVDTNGRLVIMVEKEMFFAQMDSLTEYLLNAYAENDQRAWQVIAEEYRAQAADLCYLCGTASADKLIGTGELLTPKADSAACNVSHVAIEPGIAEAILCSCELHASGYEDFARHISGEADRSISNVRKHWDSALSALENGLYRDAELEVRNLILAESRNFRQWLALHEDMLVMVYETQSEIDTAVARSYADRTILMCEATGHEEAAK